MVLVDLVWPLSYSGCCLLMLAVSCVIDVSDIGLCQSHSHASCIHAQTQVPLTKFSWSFQPRRSSGDELRMKPVWENSIETMRCGWKLQIKLKLNIKKIITASKVKNAFSHLRRLSLNPLTAENHGKCSWQLHSLTLRLFMFQFFNWSNWNKLMTTVWRESVAPWGQRDQLTINLNNFTMCIVSFLQSGQRSLGDTAILKIPASIHHVAIATSKCVQYWRWTVRNVIGNFWHCPPCMPAFKNHYRWN